MTFEKEMIIDLGVLGKRTAFISFDYTDHTYNEGVHIPGFGWVSEGLSEEIIKELWQEIKGTEEYKEIAGVDYE